MENLEERIRYMIIDRLELDDIEPESIKFDIPIFESYDETGEGLGLDSVDALELIVGINDEFNIRINEGDMKIFKSINTIADFIRSQKEK